MADPGVMFHEMPSKVDCIRLTMMMIVLVVVCRFVRT